MILSIAGMIVAAFGFLPPVVRAILQGVIDLVAVLNALRTIWRPAIYRYAPCRRKAGAMNQNLQSLNQYFRDKDSPNLGKALSQLSGFEIADLMVNKSDADQVFAFQVLAPELAAETFDYLPSRIQKKTLKHPDLLPKLPICSRQPPDVDSPARGTRQEISWMNMCICYLSMNAACPGDMLVPKIALVA